MTEAQKIKIIDKIRKLLALSKSPNEAEALAAANKAHELLLEHDLALSEVHETVETRQFVDDKTGMSDDSRPWRRFIGNALAKLYFCVYSKNTIKIPPHKRYDVHYFAGRPHDAAIAKMMFEYLEKAVARLAVEGGKTVPAKERAAYDTSFKNAAAIRLNKRIMARYEAARKGTLKTEGGTTLPAVADLYDQMEKAITDWLGDSVKDSTNRGRVTNVKGLVDGYDAGNKIGLDPQVHGKPTHLIGRN